MSRSKTRLTAEAVVAGASTRVSPVNNKTPASKAPPSSIIYLPVGAIHPDPQNPRVHPQDQVRAIARSIDAFGFNAPILVNHEDQVVAGHGRLQAAKLLEMTEVPVIRLGHLSKQQAKAYMLADNKLTDRSSFDELELGQRLKELQDLAQDFQIEATGFELPEVDLLIQSLDPLDETDPVDEFREPVGIAVSVLGDLWSLGTHSLLCGNALDALSYKTLLKTKLASAMFADCPYNVRLNGHAVGRGRKKHREFPMACSELSKPQFTDFLTTFVENARNYAQLSAVFFMCMDWRHLPESIAAIDRTECEMINLCVWAKSNGGMGPMYRSAHELVFVFRRRNAKHLNNIQLGRYGRNRTNVWHYPGMSSFGGRQRAHAENDHPTPKPVAMVMDAILDVTQRGDVVLDPFCGSGTTILAAERTGRCGYGIELDPLYVDLTIRRWQKMTGRIAMHASGKTFAEICQERGNAAVAAAESP